MPNYFFFDGKLYERMNPVPVYTPPQPGTPEYVGPDFDDPTPRKPVVISAAQYDDLRGLVSDLKVMITDYRTEAEKVRQKWMGAPEALVQPGDFQRALDTAAFTVLLENTLQQHPSLKDLL